MPSPVVSISSKTFSLSGPNPPFKVFGDNLDMWTLLDVNLHSNGCVWPKPTVLAVTKNFIQLRANPTPNPPPPAPAPDAAPPVGGAVAAANGDDDLTITLTFDDGTGTPTDIVLDSEGIDYVP